MKENYSFQDLQRIMFRLLDKVEVFNGLTQQELLQILETADKRTVDPGETIVKEGSTGAFLYVLIDGRVSVIKGGGATGRGTELAQLLPGDSFGEMSLVDQDVRSASVIALERCIMLRLAEGNCWKFPQTGAKIFRNIARTLSKRLRDMDEAYVRIRARLG